jgi:hypothetical protein
VRIYSDQSARIDRSACVESLMEAGPATKLPMAMNNPTYSDVITLDNG